MPPGFEVDDVVSEALTRALAEDSSLVGAELYERAKAQISAVRKDGFWEKKRAATVRTVARESATSDKPTFRRRPTKPRGLPKGTARFATHEVGPTVLPQSPGDTLDPDRRGAVERLVHEGLMRIAAGEPCTPRAAALLDELYAEIYGVPPGYHWAHLMISELERAKRQTFTLESAPEEGTHAPSFVSYTRKGEGAAPEVVNVRAIQTPTTKDRAKIEFYGELDGKDQLLGTVLGTFGDEFVYSTLDDERAQQILQQVRLQLAQMYISHEIPAYADDAVLVRWLFTRFGFGGGGGPNSLKTETLRKLLIDPQALSNEILKHGRRLADRADDALGETIEQEAEQLGERVRLNGGLCDTRPTVENSGAPD